MRAASADCWLVWCCDVSLKSLRVGFWSPIEGKVDRTWRKCTVVLQCWSQARAVSLVDPYARFSSRKVIGYFLWIRRMITHRILILPAHTGICTATLPTPHKYVSCLPRSQSTESFTWLPCCQPRRNATRSWQRE